MTIVFILVCIFNIVMWIIFLHHFKNLFTTDDIISATKEEVNKILMDLDLQTERNLSLMDNSISKMKSLNAEIEKKLKVFDELRSSNIGTSKINEKINSKSSLHQKRNALNSYERTKNSKKNINSESTVVLTRNGEQFSAEPMQSTLFNEKNDFEPAEKSDIKLKTQEIHTNEYGETYAKVPVIEPDIYVPEKPVDLSKGKETLKDKILMFFDQGYNVDSISRELGCSATEVQFVLDIERPEV